MTIFEWTYQKLSQYYRFPKNLKSPSEILSHIGSPKSLYEIFKNRIVKYLHKNNLRTEDISKKEVIRINNHLCFRVTFKNGKYQRDNSSCSRDSKRHERDA